MTPLVFFDLDGTLTDPKIGITACLQYAHEKVGVEVPEADDLVWCIGPPLLESLETLVGAARAQVALEAYRERFSEVGWAENSPYGGIHSALERLRASGRRLSVATSKPHVYARKILEHFELATYFDHIFGAELDGTRSAKTELLQYAISRSPRADDMTMVGDRSHDVVGALANGIVPVGVSYGYGSVDELRAAGARVIVDAPADLANQLLGESAER